MSKKEKILLFLLVMILVTFIYLIITSESSIIKNKETENFKENDNYLEELEDSYKQKVSEILSKYLKLAEGSDFNIKQINDVRNELLNLKMPAKYKDLHLSIVLAINKMENYLLAGNEQIKMESQQIINQVKANYIWLDKGNEDPDSL